MRRIPVAAYLVLLSVSLSASVITGLVPQKSSGTFGWNLGTRFRTAVAGKVAYVAYFRDASDPGPHTGRLWSATGQKLAEVLFTNESASGPQQQAFDMPVPLAAGAAAVVTVTNPIGAHYALIPGGFATPLVDGPITYYQGAFNVQNVLDTFPSNSTPTNYLREIGFVPDVVPTVGIVATPNMPGSFDLKTSNFHGGDYLLIFSLRDQVTGVTTSSSVPIVMPNQLAPTVQK